MSVSIKYQNWVYDNDYGWKYFWFNHFIPIKKNLFATETPIAWERPEGKFPPEVQALACSPMSISALEEHNLQLQ